VIDDSCSLRHRGCLSRVGGIGGHPLRSLGCMPVATYGSHSASPAQELGNDGTADAAGRAKDDVGGVEGHGRQTLAPWN
jgi:hypothetical protein